MATFYKHCEDIRRLYDEENDIEISDAINNFSNLICNERLFYTDPFFVFGIPNILFQFLLLDKTKDASINCLINISSFNQSETLFQSEDFCRNLLSAFHSEKDQKTLGKIIDLFYNVFLFNNAQINSFIIQNNFLKGLIIKLQGPLNEKTLKTSFDLISILCNSNLVKEDVDMIYRLICKFSNDYELLNYYFMKIFYNLLGSGSFLYEEFIKNKFYNFVNAVILKNKLNRETLYGIKIIKILIQKYECHQYFNDIQLLNLFVIEPKIKEDEECLLSITNTITLYIDKSLKVCSQLLNENSFKNILYLAQARNVPIKLAIVKMLIGLVTKMTSENFKLTFLTVKDQNIFNILDDLIATNVFEGVKYSLDLICLIFTKSTAYKLNTMCKKLFQAVFTPSFFDELSEFDDNMIRASLYQIHSFIIAK